ncbi:hypothetical protein [Marinobacterium rhizophilum]|uniref:Uncharacterized protein n=1 Tax=Marinobacterium rhizophilum TaxID=420402 RepID=A0ABY5HM50_9GAMM|nr:hypothetical protein [Marinobacterium rhizophilum]UTW12332.1 hypothetical protein KDW95_01210 [Marinobacterium rhizophilum]
MSEANRTVYPSELFRAAFRRAAVRRHASLITISTPVNHHAQAASYGQLTLCKSVILSIYSLKTPQKSVHSIVGSD